MSGSQLAALGEEPVRPADPVEPDDAAAPVPERSVIPSLSRYEVLQRLAVGGMAEIFIAQRKGAQDICVLKLLHQHLLKDSVVSSRFLREAQVASLLDHPNIARLTDAKRENGQLFLAMAFIAGQDVEGMMFRLMDQRKMLPPELSLTVTLDVLAGLHHAHEFRGPDGAHLEIVHRDLSPRNVMVTYDGEVKIIDFGLARTNLGDFRTQPGMVMGTLRYMSPEQAVADPVDRRSDIYSWSVVLYEMLSGRPLISGHGGAQEVLHAVVTQVPPPLSTLNPMLPKALDAVLEKGLAKDRRDRWATAADLRSALIEAAGPLAAVDAERHRLIGDFVKDLFREEHARTEQLLREARRPRPGSRGAVAHTEGLEGKGAGEATRYGAPEVTGYAAPGETTRYGEPGYGEQAYGEKGYGEADAATRYGAPGEAGVVTRYGAPEVTGYAAPGEATRYATPGEDTGYGPPPEDHTRTAFLPHTELRPPRRAMPPVVVEPVLPTTLVPHPSRPPEHTFAADGQVMPSVRPMPAQAERGKLGAPTVAAAVLALLAVTAFLVIVLSFEREAVVPVNVAATADPQATQVAAAPLVRAAPSAASAREASGSDEGREAALAAAAAKKAKAKAQRTQDEVGERPPRSEAEAKGEPKGEAKGEAKTEARKVEPEPKHHYARIWKLLADAEREIQPTQGDFLPKQLTDAEDELRKEAATANRREIDSCVDRATLLPPADRAARLKMCLDRLEKSRTAP